MPIVALCTFEAVHLVQIIDLANSPIMCHLFRVYMPGSVLTILFLLCIYCNSQQQGSWQIFL